MVIYNGYLSKATIPRNKAYAELIVDPNTVLSRPASLQFFKSVAWRNSKVIKTHCCINQHQLSERHLLDVLWQLRRKLLVVYFFCFFISK